MNREERNVQQKSRESGGTAAGRIVSVLFTLLVLLLVFRVGFMALGANASNAFVGIVYSITDVMVAPFTGIFGEVDPGTGGTVEPAALIAILVVAVVGLLLNRLLTPRAGNVVHETNVTEDEYREPERTVVREREPEVVRERVVEDRRGLPEDRVVEDRRDLPRDRVDDRRDVPRDRVVDDRRDLPREHAVREEMIREERVEDTRRIDPDDPRR